MSKIYIVNYDDNGDIVCGGGYLYAGKLESVQGTDVFTNEGAKHFVEHNVANMDSIALVAGAMQLELNDVTRKPMTGSDGSVLGFLNQPNPMGNTFSTGAATFDLTLLNKYILTSSNFISNETTDTGFKCLSYGETRNIKSKFFDLMFVQTDINTGDRYVWLMLNCVADDKYTFNTDTSTAQVSDYTFYITKNRHRNCFNSSACVYTFKIIKGE